MLLKAEKIITHDNYLMNMSQDDMYKIVRRELAEKMIDKLVASDLMKIEITNEIRDDFGQIVKIRATTRVYNPDD